MGKPRAQVAIEELIAAKLVERTEQSTRLFPQYRLPAPAVEPEPIFLPVQFVTGVADEPPLLRRVRQTGDDMLLRMVVDLYGQVVTDATFGVPLSVLKLYSKEADAVQKVAEIGVHAIWAIKSGDTMQGLGPWRELHDKGPRKDERAPFWPRVHTLVKLGAVWFEPWVFDGEADDAEPLFPVYWDDVRRGQPHEQIVALTKQVGAAVHELARSRSHILGTHPDALFVVLPTHHRPPALRGVARIRPEADTPGRRASWARRLQAIHGWTAAYAHVAVDAFDEVFNRPINPPRGNPEDSE